MWIGLTPGLAVVLPSAVANSCITALQFARHTSNKPFLSRPQHEQELQRLGLNLNNVNKALYAGRTEPSAHSASSGEGTQHSQSLTQVTITLCKQLLSPEYLVHPKNSLKTNTTFQNITLALEEWEKNSMVANSPLHQTPLAAHLSPSRLFSTK